MEVEATKKCPFCAEQIKAEAIKCRFCGEMLNGASAAATGTSKPRFETKVFVIPFPDGSPPTQHLFKHGSDVFPNDFQRSMGWEYKYHWDDGATPLWDQFKDYFLRRINELGQEGWDLTDPFEQPRGDYGWDRFEREEVEVPGVFGRAKRFRLTGARFMMRRVSIG